MSTAIIPQRLWRLVVGYSTLLRVTSSATGTLFAWRAAVYYRVDPIVAVLTAVLFGTALAATFALNDYVDREGDRISTPWRPIPSGIITPRQAFTTSLILYAISAASALASASKTQLVAISLILAACATYSNVWKRRLILKNVGVAVLASTLVIYPALDGPVTSPTCWLAAAGIFFFVLQKEIISDVRDQGADGARGTLTLAAKKPRFAAVSVVLANVGALLAILGLLHGRGGVALSATILGVVGGMAAWAVVVVISAAKETARWCLYLANTLAAVAAVSITWTAL